MDQGRCGVNAGEDHKRIGEKLMHFHHAVRGGAIGRPRRRHVPDAEDRQCVAALELRDNADDRHRQEQRIERIVAERSGNLPCPAEAGRQHRRRAIGETPKKAHSEQHENEFSQRDVGGERGIACDPFREIVDELPEQPANHHANHRGPVQRLREGAVTRFCIDQLHRRNSYLGKILTPPHRAEV